MHSPDHAITREELMAYLDDEVSSDRRQHVELHLRECPECIAAAEEFRQVSRLTARWKVEQAPASLRAPLPALSSSRRPLPIRQWLFGACAGAAAVIALVLVQVTRAPRMATSVRAAPQQAPSSVEIPASQGAAGSAEFQPAAPRPQSMPVESARQPQVTRTASLRISVAGFSQVRASVERITANAGGFVEELNATSTPSATRALHATLRIPAANLSTALTELRTLGHIVEDSQASTDVTDQIVDLETRLSNARMTERRLVAVLRQSGKVADVLEVEREISRVRGEIEQLDAERTNVGRRVAYASVTVNVFEEKLAEIGDKRLRERLGDAVGDGFTGAANSIIDAIVFALRVGPTAIWWLLVGVTMWVIGRRTLRLRYRPHEGHGLK